MSDYADKGKRARLYAKICFLSFFGLARKEEIEFHIMEIMGKLFLLH